MKKAPRARSLGYRYVRLLRCSNEAIVVRVVRVVLAALAIFALQWRTMMSKSGLVYVSLCLSLTMSVCRSDVHLPDSLDLQ